MILLDNKNIAQLSIDWIATHPLLFFSLAFVFIFFLIHRENLFDKPKKTNSKIDALELFDITSPSTFEMLTQSKLEEAERLLGYKLPNLLKEQLLKKNGGATYRFNYQVKGNPYEVIGDKSLTVSSLLGLDTKFEFDLVSKHTNILSSIQFWEHEILPSEMVLVAKVGSGWLILDYTHSIVVPSVKYWNPTLKKGITLAPTWEDFCSNLRQAVD